MPYIFHPLVLALPCEDLQDKLTHFFFLCMQLSDHPKFSFIRANAWNTPAISPSWASRPITSQAYLIWVCARSLRSLVLCPTWTVQHPLEVKDIYFFKGPHHGYSLELVGGWGNFSPLVMPVSHCQLKTLTFQKMVVKYT